MSAIPTTKELENVKKFPWQWAIVVLCAVVSSLFGLYVLSRNKGDESCQQINAGLQRRLDASEKKTDDLTMALLVKNGIINEIKKNTDSVVMERVGNEAKKIVKP